MLMRNGMVIMTMKIGLTKSLMKLRRTKISPRPASNFGQPEASCTGVSFWLSWFLMCWSALSNFELGLALVDVGSLVSLWTIQYKDWAKQSVYTSSNRMLYMCVQTGKHYECTTDPCKVCSLVTPKSKVYKDPIGVENGLWPLRCPQRNLNFFLQ